MLKLNLCPHGQLADLHLAEVSKNMEAEKQLKFFQSCVAAAFAERDQSIMEAEKAKEREELMTKKLNPLERIVKELTRDSAKEKKLRDALQSDLKEQSKQNEIFRKVINRFYEIRQYSLCESCEDRDWKDKCECLLHDSPEKWDYIIQGETPSSKYVTLLEEAIQKGLSQLLYCHSQHKEHIRNNLVGEYSYVKSIGDVIGEKLKQLDDSMEQS